MSGRAMGSVGLRGLVGVVCAVLVTTLIPSSPAVGSDPMGARSGGWAKASGAWGPTPTSVVVEGEDLPPFDPPVEEEPEPYVPPVVLWPSSGEAVVDVPDSEGTAPVEGTVLAVGAPAEPGELQEEQAAGLAGGLVHEFPDVDGPQGEGRVASADSQC